MFQPSPCFHQSGPRVCLSHASPPPPHSLLAILLLRMFFILSSSSWRKKTSQKPTHHCSLYCPLHKVTLYYNSSFIYMSSHLNWFLKGRTLFLSLSRPKTSTVLLISSLDKNKASGGKSSVFISLTSALSETVT